MINATLQSLRLKVVKGEEPFVARVWDMPVNMEDFRNIVCTAEYVGVTDRFRDVIRTFDVPEGETPAGFRRELTLDSDQVLRIDLVRDIAYDRNGEPRPTSVLFSADSANPYEVAPIAPLISNLTCNPGIVYDLFINNPKANVGAKYKTRDEVMEEIARILGPGCDISVELNNPFEQDFNKILEEVHKFEEMFSKYRLVVKVPHVGPVTSENVEQLLTGSKKLDRRPDEVETDKAFLGHNLALKLQQLGYRVNFTLMFEPYQTLLALQARPYFINTFLRHRLMQSTNIQKFINQYEISNDTKELKGLRDYLITNDYFTEADREMPLTEVLKYSRDLLRYRHFNDAEGSDGLDGMRHNLRVLKNSNLKDTRLIVCSMEGPNNYPDIDKLLAEPEFQDMNKKVVITAEPGYLARFTSTNQVISYQRRFMNAAKGQR